MQKLPGIILTSVLTLALAACGAGTPPKAAAPAPTAQPAGPALTHLAQIKAAGRIVLATSADYPPYEFHKVSEGKNVITGWEIDLAGEIAKELGVKLEVQESGFETLLPDLRAGKADFVMAALVMTDERKALADFSHPVRQSSQVLLTLKERASTLASAGDMNGKTIGVQAGSTGEVEARKIAGAKVKTAPKFDAVIADLLAGKVDAAICGANVGKNFEKSNPRLAVAGQPLAAEQTGIAFRKGDSELIAAVNQALAKISGDGRLSAMLSKYEGDVTESAAARPG